MQIMQIGLRIVIQFSLFGRQQMCGTTSYMIYIYRNYQININSIWGFSMNIFVRKNSDIMPWACKKNPLSPTKCFEKDEYKIW